jgi:lysophospholipid acyltransferase (LPLAT)-like uncharacterized protein
MASHLARERSPIAIIPDGPRGPSGVLKPGAITLAQRTGARILPLAFAAKPSVTLKSWDRHMIPLPFSRSIVIYGEPVEVPMDASEEQREKIRRKTEEKLNSLVREADKLAGLKN